MSLLNDHTGTSGDVRRDSASDDHTPLALDIPWADTLIVLGSGLAGCFEADELRHVADLDATVDGHPGWLAFVEGDVAYGVPSYGGLSDGGALSDGTSSNEAPSDRAFLRTPLLVAFGRRHLYEGISVAEAQAVVRAAARAGARTLILTNAAGGLRPGMRVGDIMLVTDVVSTLLGPHAASGQTPIRFATELYPEIERRALERGVRLERGVYAGVLGPSYETKAEVRMLRKMGGDVVGMSTIVEASAACELGMQVVGLSLVTNVHSETRSAKLDHAHVVDEGRAAVPAMRAAIEAALEVLTCGTVSDL